MKKIIFSIICTAVFTSCNKDTTTTPQNPATGTSSGTITGKVTQYDQYGAKCTTGLNTTTVAIVGQNYSAVTDTGGNYQLINTPPGTYNISFTKPGYGVSQKQQITFAGNGTLYVNSSIVQKATYTFLSATIKDSVEYSSIHKIFITINQVSSPNINGVMIISGSNSNPDITNPASYNNIITYYIPANTTISQYLYDNAPSGTNYYKIYPYSTAYGFSSYYNYSTNYTYYPAYGTPLSTVYTVTIP